MRTSLASLLTSAAFRIAQAQFELHHPNEALTSAITAYDLCSRMPSQTSSAFNIANLVLKCKRAKWDLRERERMRRRSPLLRDIEDHFEQTRDREIAQIKARLNAGNMGQVAAAEETYQAEESAQTSLQDVRTMFAIADAARMEKRVGHQRLRSESVLIRLYRRFQTTSLTIFPLRSCMIR